MGLDPTITYNACIVAIRDGKTQRSVFKALKINKKTLVAHLKKKKTKWALLVADEKARQGGDQKSPPPGQKGPSSEKPPAPPKTQDVQLSPYISEVMNIQGAFLGLKQPCSVKDAIDLREKAMQFEGLQDVPAWTRPKCLNPRQNEIMDGILDFSHQVIGVEGDKRTGKSTSWFNAVCEGHWEGRFRKTGLWAAGQENAMGILGDVFTDKITMQATFPLFKGMGSRTQKVFFNNTVIQAHSNNVGTTSGLDFDCVVIDECHKVIVENPEIFAMIAMTLRAKPNLKIILVMNQGEGAYQLFKKKLQEKIPPEKFAFYTLMKSDTTHITEESDLMVRTLIEASTGTAEAKRWLDNEYNASGTSFNAISLAAAYSSYDAFINYEQPIPSYKVMSFDPSGSGHPMGWYIGACNATGTKFWELESGELALGDTLKDFESRGKLTPKQILTFLLSKAKEHGIHLFISESNMNGKQMKADFLLNGFKATNQNFTTDKNQKKGASRGAMILITRDIMDDMALFLCGDTLQDTFSIYNPDAHEKSAKFKGDVADASIHCNYRLAKMSKSPYLHKRGTQLHFLEA